MYRAFVFEEKGWLSGANPYAKLAAGIALIAASIAFYSLLRALLLLIFMISLSASSGRLRSNSGSLVMSAPFALMILLAELLLTRSAAVSLAYAIRFVNIVFSASVVFTSISPDEMDFIIRSIGGSYDLAFLVSTTYKFIPVLASDFLQIIEVQKARGVDFETRNPFKLLRNYYSILVPLFVVSIVRSQQLAEALELRGYGASRRPTFLYRYDFRASDGLFLALLFAFIALVAFL
ncbi:MAG: energy-coupling factor transporter transmembrane component T family protein [Nitrososphaeria archaeon]